MMAAIQSRTTLKSLDITKPTESFQTAGLNLTNKQTPNTLIKSIITEYDEDPVAEVYDGIEIVENLYIGSEACAKDIDGMKKAGITHVLSIFGEYDECTSGDSDMVDAGIWKVIFLEDAADANILSAIDQALLFYRKVLDYSGRLLVHSVDGNSRSAGIILGLLMVEDKKSLRQALNSLEALVEVDVNRGFWRQLHALDIIIHGEPSIEEDDLPGAVIFEKEAIAKIIRDYENSFRVRLANSKRKSRETIAPSPKSPRTRTAVRGPSRRMSIE